VGEVFEALGARYRRVLRRTVKDIHGSCLIVQVCVTLPCQLSRTSVIATCVDDYKLVVNVLHLRLCWLLCCSLNMSKVCRPINRQGPAGGDSDVIHH
jgi:hypothetical protein